MKFTVLIPTRNRLVYLRFAIESVLRQNFDEWEIIVSDNYSEENIQEFVSNLNDERVKYFRTERMVNVTENWSNALRKMSGDYFILLGDDDSLTPNYFLKMRDLIEMHEYPDCIYTDGYLYGYPRTLPKFPKGYFRSSYNTYLNIKEPFTLSEESQKKIFLSSFGLMRTIRFGMHLSLINKKFADDMSRDGGFFQSRFPDYYATVATFLIAKRIVIHQQPMVVIGISPNSFTARYFSNDQGTGIQELHGTEQKPSPQYPAHYMPGSWELTGWLAAMQSIENNYMKEAQMLGASVGYRRYRFLQILWNYKKLYIDNVISSEDVAIAEKTLKGMEKIIYPYFLRNLFKLLGSMSFLDLQSIIPLLGRFAGRPTILDSTETSRRELASVMDIYNMIDIENSQ